MILKKLKNTSKFLNYLKNDKINKIKNILKNFANEQIKCVINCICKQNFKQKSFELQFFFHATFK